MNILLLTTHLNFGGIASYIVNLAGEFKKRGHNVLVVSSGGNFTDALLSQGIEHIAIDIKTKSELNPKLIFAFLKLKRVITKKNIQIIHSHTRVTQVLSFFLSKSLDIPYVVTCHGYFKPRWGRKVFACWGDKVIAISAAVKKHLIDDFYLSEDKIKLVYNGVNVKPRTQYDNEKIRVGLGFPKEAPIIGIIARLSPVKGHKYLITAMKHVLNIVTDARLLIVGDGPSKDGIVELIKDAKITDNTIMIGARGNLEELFSIMSVYVSPSVNEGLGLSLLEAQANYVPTVGFKTGGIIDVIEHEVTGLLARAFDAKALAGAIVRLLQDEELADQIRQAAYKSVGEKFSLFDMAENTINVYKGIRGA